MYAVQSMYVYKVTTLDNFSFFFIIIKCILTQYVTSSEKTYLNVKFDLINFDALKCNFLPLIIVLL